MKLDEPLCQAAAFLCPLRLFILGVLSVFHYQLHHIYYGYVLSSTQHTFITRLLIVLHSIAVSRNNDTRMAYHPWQEMDFAEILNNNTVKKYIMDDHAAADI